VVYANSIDNPFIWDDNVFIKNNPTIKDIQYFPHIFTKNLLEHNPIKGDFYRPVQGLSLMIDYFFWGSNPVGYHITNFLLHLLCALLVYFLVNDIIRNQLASFFTGLLFLIHPVQTEAVTYISGRADPLATVFILSAFLLYIRATTPISTTWSTFSYIGAIFMFIIAIFSKETSLILPVLILLYEFYISGIDKFFRDIRVIILRLAPFLGLVIIYLVIRFTLLTQITKFVHTTSVGLGARAMTFLTTIPVYIRLLFIPMDLHMERSIPMPSSLFEPRVLIALGILFFAIVCIVKTYRFSMEIPFGLVWFFVALVPVSNIITPLNAVMAEHWLYLPSIGIFMVIGIGVSKLLLKAVNTKRVIIIIITAYLIFLSTLTILRNVEWGNAIIFYKNAIRYSPDSYRLHYNLGVTYMSKNLYQEAIIEFNNAIEIDTSRVREAVKQNLPVLLNLSLPDAHYNIGIAYANQGQLEKAIEEWQKALEINPNLESAKVCIEEAKKALMK
jgi:hypothetical protein